MGLKKISETFTEEEFEQLKKKKGNMSWHDFIMTLVETCKEEERN